MWFKQIQLFQITPTIAYQPDELAETLSQLLFTPCLPSLPVSIGWVAPIDKDEAPLVHAANGYMMICLQVEQKILPATVINQTLQEKVKSIESEQARTVGHKEKQKLKAEIVFTLLPRAFSNKKRIYAYIDSNTGHLVMNTINKKDTEHFLNAWKKVFSTHKLTPPALKKPGIILTNWLAHQSQPDVFIIEEACTLQDISQQRRTINCQYQDLMVAPIQSLLKDNCEVKQLALSWLERVSFTLTNEFLLRGVRYQEAVLALAKADVSETAEQQFASDFLIMSDTINKITQDLLAEFAKQEGDMSSQDMAAVA